MSKAIQVHPLQLEALNNGATALLFVIDEKWQKLLNDAIKDSSIYYLYDEINKDSPLQAGDSFYLQEEFYTTGESDKIYFSNTGYPRCMSLKKHDASEMTYEQSRYKYDVVSVEVKRAKELSIDDAKRLTGYSWERVCEIQPSNWFDEQYGQSTYESNYNCFYVVIKPKG